jgi:hypothetical protein
MKRLMKKNVLLILLFSLFSLLYAQENLKKGSKVYVSVQECKLRESEKKFSNIVYVLKYGDILHIKKINKEKILVTCDFDDSIQGWITSGSVTKKKIVTKGKSSYVKASVDEISLAGKGLTSQNNKAFDGDIYRLRFDLVDELESIKILEKDLIEFIEEGKLF